MHDFRLGDGFAPANDAPPCGVVLDKLRLVLRARPVKILGCAAHGVPIRAFLKVKARVMQDAIHALRDGRRAGDAGGLNARGMEHTGKDGGGADHEIVQPLDDRAAPCERAHDSPGIKVGHELAGSVE